MERGGSNVKKGLRGCLQVWARFLVCESTVEQCVGLGAMSALSLNQGFGDCEVEELVEGVEFGSCYKEHQCLEQSILISN